MNEIIFMIEEDIESGFNAKALGFPIFTQGDDEKELKDNIKDALECHYALLYLFLNLDIKK